MMKEIFELQVKSSPGGFAPTLFILNRMLEAVLAEARTHRAAYLAEEEGRPERGRVVLGPVPDLAKHDERTRETITEVLTKIELWLESGDVDVQPRVKQCSSYLRYALREALFQRCPDLLCETRAPPPEEAAAGGQYKDLVIIRHTGRELTRRKAISYIEPLQWILAGVDRFKLPWNLTLWLSLLDLARVLQECDLDRELFVQLRSRLRRSMLDSREGQNQWAGATPEERVPGRAVLTKLVNLYTYPTPHADERVRHYRYQEADADGALSLFYALRARGWSFDELGLRRELLNGLRDVLVAQNGSAPARARLFALGMHCVQTLEKAPGTATHALDSACVHLLVDLAPTRDTRLLGRLLVTAQKDDGLHLDLGVCLALVTSAAEPKDAMMLIQYGMHAGPHQTLRRNMDTSGDGELFVRYFNSLDPFDIQHGNGPVQKDRRFSFRHIWTKHLHGKITETI